MPIVKILGTVKGPPGLGVIPAGHEVRLEPERARELMAAGKARLVAGGEELVETSFEDAHTKAELVEMAQEEGIEGYSTMNKAELAEVLS